MTVFPSLQPSARSFTPGEVSVTSFQSMSGKETRVLQGDTPHSHRLSLSFDNILDAAGQQILTHWEGQLGIGLAFSLPPAVYAGWSLYQAAIPAGQQWRYERMPSVTFVAPGIMTVSVALVSLS